MAGEDENNGGRVTSSELARRLDRFEKSTGDRFDDLAAQIAGLNVVQPEVMRALLQLEANQREALAGRVKLLEDENIDRKREARNNQRLAITAIAGPLFVAVLSGLILWAIIGAHS